MPPERRITDDGWESFLSRWEQEVLLDMKRTFVRHVFSYNEFRPYLANIQDEALRFRLGGQILSDSLDYPGRDPYELAEGERRLREARQRLSLLVEKLPSIELSVEHQAMLRDSLRSPPAPEAAIQAAETRLNVRLPPTYRYFLSLSNGWLINKHPSLWPVDKVARLQDINPGYVRTWLEHEFIHETTEFVVTSKPLGKEEPFVTHDMDVPTTALKQMLAIGADMKEGDYLLLDPTESTEQGEWRALVLFRGEFAIAGRDFARLMEILYRLECPT